MSWTSLKEKSEKVGILAFEEGGRLKKEVSGWIIAFTRVLDPVSVDKRQRVRLQKTRGCLWKMI